MATSKKNTSWLCKKYLFLKTDMTLPPSYASVHVPLRRSVWKEACTCIAAAIACTTVTACTLPLMGLIKRHLVFHISTKKTSALQKGWNTRCASNSLLSYFRVQMCSHVLSDTVVVLLRRPSCTVLSLMVCAPMLSSSRVTWKGAPMSQWRYFTGKF